MVDRPLALDYTPKRGGKSIAKSKAEIQRDYEKRTGYAAQAKYLKERGKSVAFRLISPQDDDILQRLEEVPSKAGYIKQLIRQDIQKDQ